MKKIIIGILALMIGAGVAQAAITVTLDQDAAGLQTTSTFTYSNLSMVATFDGGALNPATVVTENTLTGARGSFTIDWSATDLSVPEVASNWSFGPACGMYSFANGLGVQSAGQAGGARMFTDGEAFLLTFNTNNLILEPGKFLVFSVQATKAGETFKIYQRTGASNGVEVASFPSSASQSFSPVVTVDGTLEFAIVDPGWDGGGALQLGDFKIDVIDQITGTETPTGLSGIALSEGSIMSWKPDTTGFLDYYTVYRSTVSGSNNYVAITNVVSTEFIDSGLTNGVPYYYAVTAVGTNGTPIESAYSEEVSITPVALDTNTVLLMHYDASLSDSVAIGTNGLVDVWTNQVTPGTYDATKTWEGFVYPSTNLSASGLAGMDCTTNPSEYALMDPTESDVLLDTTGGKSGFVVIAAIRPEGLGVQQDLIGNTSTVSSGFGLRWTGAGFAAWLGTPSSVNLATTATLGDTIVVSIRFDVKTLEYSGWESASLNSFSVTRLPKDYSVPGDGLNLARTVSDTRDFEGQIFEVKIWGSTLDDATLEAERNAMVTKWVGLAGYDLWAKNWTVNIGESTNDFDADGLNNLYEYGLNGNPTNGTQSPATLPAFMKVGGGFEYIHPVLSDDDTLAYTVQTTTNLVSGVWTNAGYTVSGTNVTGGTLNSVTNAVDALENEKFIRLRIEQN